MLSTYADMEELIRLGAYRTGSDPLVDRAIRLQPALDAFLDTMAGNTAVDPATRDALALLSKQVSVPHGVGY